MGNPDVAKIMSNGISWNQSRLIRPSLHCGDILEYCVMVTEFHTLPRMYIMCIKRDCILSCMIYSLYVAYYAFSSVPSRYSIRSEGMLFCTFTLLMMYTVEDPKHAMPLNQATLF